MKFRTDFVTNSSSSSFIVAKKDGFSEVQVSEILKYVEEIMGDKVLTPQSTEEEIDKYFEDGCFSTEEEKRIRKALSEGKNIYVGNIDFEMCEIAYGEVYQNLWEKLGKDKNNFEEIDTDINY